MAKRCELTGKTVQSGNNVSHAKNRTRRRFLPNLQQMSFASEALGSVRLKVCTAAIRTVEKAGGLDAFLLGKSNSKLTDEALTLKKKIVKASTTA
ncbi:MAG: 50S ribosomal protein L28 [Alphaproteobacteria bacterium]